MTPSHWAFVDRLPLNPHTPVILHPGRWGLRYGVFLLCFPLGPPSPLAPVQLPPSPLFQLVPLPLSGDDEQLEGREERAGNAAAQPTETKVGRDLT